MTFAFKFPTKDKIVEIFVTLLRRVGAFSVEANVLISRGTAPQEKRTVARRSETMMNEKMMKLCWKTEEISPI